MPQERADSDTEFALFFCAKAKAEENEEIREIGEVGEIREFPA